MELFFENIPILTARSLTSNSHSQFLNLIQYSLKCVYMLIEFKLIDRILSGPCLIIKKVFPGMGIPMLKIRQPQDHLISNMGIPILVRWHLYIEMPPGAWFNVKMTSYQYRKSHCGDKTILRPSYLHNGISYTGKMTSLQWDAPWLPLAHSVYIPWHYHTCIK